MKKITNKKYGSKTKSPEKEYTLFLEDGQKKALSLINGKIIQYTKSLDPDGEGILIQDHDDSEIFSIESDEMPNCCAITVLGNYTIHPGVKENSIKEIATLLDAFIKGRKNHTYMVNTVVDDKMDKILCKVESVTCVKEFVNANTERKIRIYLSNNE